MYRKIASLTIDYLYIDIEHAYIHTFTHSLS